MKNIYLKSGKVADIFNDLKVSLNGTLESLKDELELNLHSDIATGRIKGTSLPNGMTYIDFNVSFHEDLRVSMESLMKSPIYFLYCSDGNLKHSMGIAADKKVLKKNQTGILKNSSGVNDIFYFEKNRPIRFTVIGVETAFMNIGQNEQFIKKIKNRFFTDKESYFDISIPNLEISNKLQELATNTQKAVCTNRILENILEMEMELQMDGFEKVSENINFYLRKQLSQINEVSSLLRTQTTEITYRLLLPRMLFSPNRMMNFILGFMRIEKQRI